MAGDERALLLICWIVYFTNIEKEKNGRKTIFTDLSISSCLVTFAAINENEIDHKAVVTFS